MKTPSYWKSINLYSLILMPVGWLYAFITALRLLIKKSHHVTTPVICVGNLTAGGTGKTPVAISIAKLLQKNGKNPYFVSRGYGGKLKNVIVNSKLHQAQDVGDEPMLLSRQASVAISPDRYCGALLAEQEGADFIIMDDGFQNPSLHKDISFLVFDGNSGLGNGLCIPAGPLREFACLGIRRSDAIIIIGEDRHNLTQKYAHLPIFKGRIKPVLPSSLTYDIVAFAGIGNPDKFYNTLTQCGFKLVATKDFPDHHFYSEDELNELVALGKKHKAPIYTTAKDFVKVPPHLQCKFKVLEIEIEWENSSELVNFMLHAY